MTHFEFNHWTKQELEAEPCENIDRNKKNINEISDKAMKDIYTMSGFVKHFDTKTT